MSFRKFPSRPLSIEEWELILSGLEELKELLQSGVVGPLDNPPLEGLIQEFTQNIKTYKQLEP